MLVCRKCLIPAWREPGYARIHVPGRGELLLALWDLTRQRPPLSIWRDGARRYLSCFFFGHRWRER